MRTFKLVNKKKFLSFKRKKFDFKSDEALAKVLYSGVCGSDLSVYLGHYSYNQLQTVPESSYKPPLIAYSILDHRRLFEWKYRHR